MYLNESYTDLRSNQNGHRNSKRKSNIKSAVITTAHRIRYFTYKKVLLKKERLNAPLDFRAMRNNLKIIFNKQINLLGKLSMLENTTKIRNSLALPAAERGSSMRCSKLPSLQPSNRPNQGKTYIGRFGNSVRLNDHRPFDTSKFRTFGVLCGILILTNSKSRVAGTWKHFMQTSCFFFTQHCGLFAV